VPAYADYGVGASVEIVTSTDSGTDKMLTLDVMTGINVLTLDDRQNLVIGDVIRVGQANDADVEYVTIRDIPRRLSGNDPGQVVLTAALQKDHPINTPICKQAVTLAPPALSYSVLFTQRNATELVVSDTTDITAPAILRVSVASDQTYYHRMTAPPVTPDPKMVTLGSALDRPHSAGTQVAAREPLLSVRALDARECARPGVASRQHEDSYEWRHCRFDAHPAGFGERY
jgi:hypothetical protein